MAAFLLASVLALTGTVAGQEAPPTPSTTDLGLNVNDVRDEPSHPDDDNGFPDDHEGDFWSPETDPLVLDAYVQNGFVGEDVDNIVNRVQHGDNYEDQERTMYPGSNFFAAWWGWWSDHGGGGDLQESDVWSDTPFVGEPNGAIDDAEDCDGPEWDEFTWRGDHGCPSQISHPAYPDDQMFGFVQPGTHFNLNDVILYEGPVDGTLDSESDGDQETDFSYGQPEDGQFWWIEGNRALFMYDNSLLISTSVVTAVNPQETSTESGVATYDPFQPAESLEDPDGDHAVDIDIYTTPDPLVEEVYRTAVWDPDTGPHQDRGDNPDLVHEDGLKGWLKDDGAALKAQAEEDAAETQEQLLGSTQRQRGLVDDLVQDPFFHEPNQPGDDYNGWASHDPATSYGGLDGDYYEPGPNQKYTGYQEGERFWFDAQIQLQTLPYWIPPGAIGYRGEQFTPEVPNPSEPVESAASEDTANQGPGILFMDAWAGTWHDSDAIADEDGWVGDANDAAPYENGTVDDPNGYEAEESLTIPQGASGPEWRGTCNVEISATLYPTSDTDGDGTNDWGAAGVYVMGSFRDGNPYSNVWSDAIGPAADPVLDPLRDNQQIGGTASYMFPEDDDQLSRHRTEGPIEVREWDCLISHAIGNHPALYNIILPTGTLDFTFKSVANATLTDQSRVGQHGDTDGVELAGASITDVDRYGRMLAGDLG